MRSSIFEISLVIAGFILGWQKTGWNSLFYIALGLIAFYAIVIIIYIATKGATMSLLDKLLGVLALAGWVGIAFVMIQEKGLRLWELFY
ncbi:MAG TPA: hypothetical protein VN426_10800 [Syntrophomonadaceae bacterium]|nr:hypothetical protein [Syntrophomonadaceae bacterium]